MLAGFVVVAAFGGLGYTMFTRSVVYYRTPTEVLRAPGMHVRLSGTVVDGSIRNDIAPGTVAFEVTDGRTTVPVLFHGAAPDALRSGGEAVAEGALRRRRHVHGAAALRPLPVEVPDGDAGTVTMTTSPALAIRLEGVGKRFGAQAALDGIDLDVPAGSYVAVMGANGAGKTTLLHVIAGLTAPTAGRVTIAGVDMRRAGPRLRAQIGVVGHQPMLYPDLTAGENLRFHARLFGVPDPERRPSRRQRR